MAGGNFDRHAGKVRPGTYINFESTRRRSLGVSDRGTVLLPLINHPYGPEKEFITIDNTAPESLFSVFGYSVFAPEMLLVHEALKEAATVIAYIPKQGEKARTTQGQLTATAKHGGARGNDLRFSITVNPTGGFDVTIWLKNETVFEVFGLTTVEQLSAVDTGWIDFSGTGNLVENAGLSLSGGVTGVASNGDIIAFLEAAEGPMWNAMALPIAEPALIEAAVTKIKYLREDMGKYRSLVVSGVAADYEGVINVTNGVLLEDGTVVDAVKATAYVAGMDASAFEVGESLTYKPYIGAVRIVGEKSHEQTVAAINNGELFFSWNERGAVAVEYDINTLLTFDPPKDETYRKNRVRRILDLFGTRLKVEFPPNKFTNDSVNWSIMEGLGRELLRQFQEARLITNVIYGSDFVVDRGASEGDSTFFTVGIQPVDSSDKLFFTAQTR